METHYTPKEVSEKLKLNIRTILQMDQRGKDKSR